MALENLSADVRSALGAARDRLDGNDLVGALALYDELLATEGDSGDVLLAISGDLGATGNVTPLIELIAPRYELERDGPAAGLNLLQAYLVLGNADAAKHMLDRLSALGRPELAERLMGFSNAISGLVQTGAAPSLARPQPAARGAAVSVSKPIWFYGLEPLAPQILPAKQGALRRVAFTQLALTAAFADVGDAMKRPEDEPGRLSRAIPAWLAETFHFTPDYAPIAALAVVSDPDGTKRPALLDAEWTIENMRQLVQTTTDGLDYLFTGILNGRDGVYHLSLRLWEVKRFRERRQFDARWTPATADAELVRLRDEICRFMEWRPCAAGAGIAYVRPNEPFAWIDALGASLGLFLAGKAIWPKNLLAPLAPTRDALAPMAARDPVAALAWLTMTKRARDLGLDAGEDVPLVDDPMVEQAKELLQ